jgi:DNA integrity scanning protein DisA with diadenylate cyclase activity
MGLSALLAHLLQAARFTADQITASAILLFAERDLPWPQVMEQLSPYRLFAAVTDSPPLSAELSRFPQITLLELEPRPIPARELLSLALLEALATEKLPRGGVVVALYNSLALGGVSEPLDTLSVIPLGENLEQLPASDLRRLETQVPLKTLKAVVDLAVEIGREGREGKPVGTMFVVGDARKVGSFSHALGFDPVRGYCKADRNLRDRRVRESIKEIAKLDGAFIVDKDGTVTAAARYIDVQAEGITLSKGLGSRHWAAAAVSKRTQAIAVVVSESTGIVRVFQQGEIRLYIPPFARPSLWRIAPPEEDRRKQP